MNKVYVYGYFAIEDFTHYGELTGKSYPWSISFKKGKCFYIGVSTNSIEERHDGHMAPSKRHISLLNEVLQKNTDKWEVIQIGKYESHFNTKKVIHSIERAYIKEYEPKLNVYGRS